MTAVLFRSLLSTIFVSTHFVDEILILLESFGLCGEIALTRKAGRERLSILKFTKRNGENTRR